LIDFWVWRNDIPNAIGGKRKRYLYERDMYIPDMRYVHAVTCNDMRLVHALTWDMYMQSCAMTRHVHAITWDMYTQWLAMTWDIAMMCDDKTCTWMYMTCNDMSLRHVHTMTCNDETCTWNDTRHVHALTCNGAMTCNNTTCNGMRHVHAMTTDVHAMTYINSLCLEDTHACNGIECFMHFVRINRMIFVRYTNSAYTHTQKLCKTIPLEIQRA